MLDLKNLPVIEAVAEVLSETKAALKLDLQKQVDEVKALEARISEASILNEEKHSAEFEEIKRQLAEASESGLLTAQLQSEIKSIEQSHSAIKSELEDLRSAVSDKIAASIDLQQAALEAVAEQTVKQLSEEIIKRDQEIVECSEALDALNESQLKIFDTTKALQEKQEQALVELSQKIDARLAQVKDGADGTSGRDGERGLDGRDGVDGKDGRDRPVIETMLVRHGDKVDKNTLVSHAGGLFMTSRKANGSPEEDAAGYNCIVNGVADITFEQTELRKTEMRIELSDGLVIDHTIENHAPIFRGPFKKDVDYQINDIVIKDHKTLIKVSHEGDRQWQMFVFPERGEKGEVGGTGEKGADGVGIKDIFSSDSNLLFEMTDGRVHTIELALPDLNGDFDGAPVRSFRGFYDANQNYSEGEIVRLDNSLWLATERTSDYPSGKSGDWVQMIASSVGGSGTGNGEQGPRGPMGPPGKNGADGDSAYKIATENGFVGTEQEWLDSLQGEAGPSAVSADPDNAAFISPNDGLIYVPQASSTSVTVGETPPTDAPDNSLWFNSSTGGLYVYYNDGTSSQWVQTTSAPGSATMFTGELPPPNPAKDQLWFNSKTASMFAYYVDATSSQWVEIVSIGAAPELNKLQTEVADLKAQVAALTALIQK